MPLEHLDDGVPKTFLVSILRKEFALDSFLGRGLDSQVPINSPKSPCMIHQDLQQKDETFRSDLFHVVVHGPCCAMFGVLAAPSNKARFFWGGDVIICMDKWKEITSL